MLIRIPSKTKSQIRSKLAKLKRRQVSCFLDKVSYNKALINGHFFDCSKEAIEILSELKTKIVTKCMLEAVVKAKTLDFSSSNFLEEERNTNLSKEMSLVSGLIGNSTMEFQIDERNLENFDSESKSSKIDFSGEFDMRYFSTIFESN